MSGRAGRAEAHARGAGATPSIGAEGAPGWVGILRSLVVYWRPGRQRGLRRFYGTLVAPGDLVFDVGAHLGDRSAAFAALGARVVALEPQPHLLPWLRRLIGANDRVTLRSEAVGSAPGTARLSISRGTPTVSTLSNEWREAVTRTNPGFRGVRWDRSVEVEVVTLDQLISEHGVPQFCKIDVEGLEAEVLAGLSQPLTALSVEFVAGGLDVALACVDRLETLASYEYNVVPGERRDFVFGSWMGPAQIRAWLRDRAGGFSSGDLYARRLELGATTGTADDAGEGVEGSGDVHG